MVLKMSLESETSTGEVTVLNVLIYTAELRKGLSWNYHPHWKAGPRRSSASCASTGYSLGKQGATSKNVAGPTDATARERSEPWWKAARPKSDIFATCCLPMNLGKWWKMRSCLAWPWGAKAHTVLDANILVILPKCLWAEQAGLDFVSWSRSCANYIKKRCFINEVCHKRYLQSVSQFLVGLKPLTLGVQHLGTTETAWRSWQHLQLLCFWHHS